MALVTQSIAKAAVTPTAMAAPTTSEVIAAPGPGVFLQLVVGGTATTFTMVRPGFTETGDAVADYVLTSITNTERWIPVLREFDDSAAGGAVLTLSQVTGVTTRVVRCSV